MRVVKPTKRKSTVVSSQTYRKMVEVALEAAPACALDLHGIYEALAERYEQYRGDSVEVDWRVKTNFSNIFINVCFRILLDTACP
jgi:hypothetical protein